MKIERLFWPASILTLIEDQGVLNQTLGLFSVSESELVPYSYSDLLLQKA